MPSSTSTSIVPLAVLRAGGEGVPPALTVSETIVADGTIIRTANPSRSFLDSIAVVEDIHKQAMSVIAALQASTGATEPAQPVKGDDEENDEGADDFGDADEPVEGPAEKQRRLE